MTNTAELPEDILHFRNAIPPGDWPAVAARKRVPTEQAIEGELPADLRPLKVSAQMTAAMRKLLGQIRGSLLTRG